MKNKILKEKSRDFPRSQNDLKLQLNHSIKYRHPPKNYKGRHQNSNGEEKGRGIHLKIKRWYEKLNSQEKKGKYLFL